MIHQITSNLAGIGGEPAALVVNSDRKTMFGYTGPVTEAWQSFNLSDEDAAWNFTKEPGKAQTKGYLVRRVWLVVEVNTPISKVAGDK